MRTDWAWAHPGGRNLPCYRLGSGSIRELLAQRISVRRDRLRVGKHDLPVFLLDDLDRTSIYDVHADRVIVWMSRDFLIGPVGIHCNLRDAGQALIHVVIQRVLVRLGGQLGRIQFGFPGPIERALSKQCR